MKNKKAFEIQFNWIFVLIAGAVILMFFATIIVKQKSSAEISTKATILKSVQAIVASAGISTSTINVVELPKSDIEVDCNKISVGGVSKQYQKLILFSPSAIKDNKLITHTKEFSMPYRVTNMLYITSPQIKYVLIGNDDVIKEINKILPTYIKKEFYETTPSTIKRENSYKIRFVVFGDAVDFASGGLFTSELVDMADVDVTAIKIDGTLEKGIIEFWQKNGNLWTSKGNSVYIGMASLLGAVYADSLESYECNMKNVLTRFDLVTKIYDERTTDIWALPSTSARCAQSYENALSAMADIKTKSIDFDFSESTVNVIVGDTTLISNENQNLELNSCILIY